MLTNVNQPSEKNKFIDYSPRNRRGRPRGMGTLLIKFHLLTLLPSNKKGTKQVERDTLKKKKQKESMNTFKEKKHSGH